MRVERKTTEQLLLMRKAGLVVAEGLAAMGDAIHPGATTAEVDAVAREVLARAGAASSFLNYGAEYGVGFPGVACISVNDEIVHGIPGDRVLQPGDIVSCDFGAIIEGWHGDAARTFFVGTPSDADRALSEATREAMWAGIAAAKLGQRIGHISHAIESYATSLPIRYGIVREYTGHGIGSQMHMAPDVPNYGRRLQGPKLTTGMALAIEPMLVAGSEATIVADDEWTVLTEDGGRGAHWENTITVTERGVWVLTEPDGGEAELTRRGVAFGPLAD